MTNYVSLPVTTLVLLQLNISNLSLAEHHPLLDLQTFSSSSGEFHTSQSFHNKPQAGEIARQVTVRILTEPGMGSGVIIARKGQVYSVLTCDHVLANSYENRYQVMTSDGQQHPAYRLNSVLFKDLDLAILQFTSQSSYKVAAMGESSTLTNGAQVYAAGYPIWHWANKNTLESTRDWDLKAFRLTIGKIRMLNKKSLPGGYKLGYTNDIENGMSGGPVLDQDGQLVGINGRLKYPFQGIEAFQFTDGTLPSEELFLQMEALSWAIPVHAFNYKSVFRETEASP